MSRPHAIVVSPWQPEPTVFGSAHRVAGELAMLAELGWTTTLVTLRSYESQPDQPADEVVWIDRRSRAEARRRAAISGHSIEWCQQVLPAIVSEVAELARSRARRPDAVLFEGSFLAAAIPTPGVRRVLSMHNDEGVLAHSVARTRPAPKRWAALLDARRLAREEARAVASVDAVVVPSAVEQSAWANRHPNVSIVANTMVLPPLRASSPVEPLVLFLGTMHVPANAEGARWLLDEIVPRTQHVTHPAFCIVGGSPPPDLSARGVQGFVADLEPLWQRASVFVCPLLTGSGTRLKLIEAFARGVPTVTTTKGAEGLEAVDRVHCLIADDPVEFAAAVDLLTADRGLAEELAANARLLAEQYAPQRWAHALGDALTPGQ